MSQQKALNEADALILRLNSALSYAAAASEAIVLGDPAKLEEAIIALEDFGITDITVHEMSHHLEELQQTDREGAHADDQFDYERDGAMEAEAR